MSVIQDLEGAAEKVFHEAEAKIEDLDGQALAEARRLLADARTAESRIDGVVKSFEAEIVARAKQLAADLGPGVEAELVAALQAEAGKLLATLLALFGIGA
jgi:vacuolar-type H+-ATPase subunit E/Vma4